MYTYVVRVSSIYTIQGGNMKKKIMVIGLLALLLGCGGPKYKMYSVFDKQEMIEPDPTTILEETK